jgi:hypothetical protein
MTYYSRKQIYYLVRKIKLRSKGLYVAKLTSHLEEMSETHGNFLTK